MGVIFHGEMRRFFQGLTFIILFINGVSTFAQTDTITWQDGLCIYLSEFKTDIYSRAQIQNCLRMARFQEFDIGSWPMVFHPQDLNKLDSNNLINEFRKKHIKALNSDDYTLYDDWYSVRELMASKNGYPENIRAEYKEMLNSPMKRTYARIDIINFGWWNCVIHHIKRLSNSLSEESIQAAIDSLFVKTTTIDCDEP